MILYGRGSQPFKPGGPAKYLFLFTYPHLTEGSATCTGPVLPPNSKTVFEDWWIGGRGVLVRCSYGFGFGADPNATEVELTCVDDLILGLTWLPDTASMTCESNFVHVLIWSSVSDNYVNYRTELDTLVVHTRRKQLPRYVDGNRGHIMSMWHNTVHHISTWIGATFCVRFGV